MWNIKCQQLEKKCNDREMIKLLFIYYEILRSIKSDVNKYLKS